MCLALALPTPTRCDVVNVDHLALVDLWASETLALKKGQELAEVCPESIPQDGVARVLGGIGPPAPVAHESVALHLHELNALCVNEQGSVGQYPALDGKCEPRKLNPRYAEQLHRRLNGGRFLPLREAVTDRLPVLRDVRGRHSRQGCILDGERHLLYGRMLEVRALVLLI